MQLADIIEHFAQYPEIQAQIVTPTEKYEINQLISNWLTGFFQKYDIQQLLDILTRIGLTFQDNNTLKQQQYQNEFRKRYIIALIMHKILNNQALHIKYPITNNISQQGGQQLSKAQIKQEMIHQVNPVIKLLKVLQQNIPILKIQQLYKTNENQMKNIQFRTQNVQRKDFHTVNYSKLVEEDFNITHWLVRVQIDLLQLTCESLMKFNQTIIMNQIQEFIMNLVEQINKFNIQFDQHGQINIDSHIIFKHIVIIGSLLSCIGQYYAQHYIKINNEKYTVQENINEQVVKVLYALISILMSKISYIYIKESNIDEIKQQLQSKINSDISSDQDLYQRFLMEICLYFISVFILPLLLRLDNIKQYTFQNIYNTVDTFKTAIDAVTYIFKGQQYAFTYIQQSLAMKTLQIRQNDEEITHTSFLAIQQRKMTQDITKLLPKLITEQNMQIFSKNLAWSLFYGDIQITQLQSLVKSTHQMQDFNERQTIILVSVISAINQLYSLHTGHFIDGIQIDNQWDEVYLNCFYNESFQNSVENIVKLTQINHNSHSFENFHQFHLSDLFYQNQNGNKQEMQTVQQFYGNCSECNRIESVFGKIVKEVLTIDLIHDTYIKTQDSPFSTIMIMEYIKILQFTQYFNQSASYLDACKMHECICKSVKAETMLKTFIQLGETCKLIILDSLCVYSLGSQQQESIILSQIQTQQFSTQNMNQQQQNNNYQNSDDQCKNHTEKIFNFKYLQTKETLIDYQIQYYQELCDFKSIDGIMAILEKEKSQKPTTRCHNFSCNNITSQQQLFQELDSIIYKDNAESQIMETILMMLNIVNIFTFITDQKTNKIKIETQLLAILQTFLQNSGLKDYKYQQNSFLGLKWMFDQNFINMEILARINVIKQAFFFIVSQTLTIETMAQIQQIMIYGIKHADIFSKLMVEKQISQIVYSQKQDKQNHQILKIIMSSVVLDLYDIIQFLQSFPENEINQSQFQSWKYVSIMVNLPNIQQNLQQINENITYIYNNIIQKQLAISTQADMFSIIQQQVYINRTQLQFKHYDYLPFLCPKIYTEHLAKDEQDNTLTSYDIKVLSQKPQVSNEQITNCQQSVLLNTSIAFSTQIVKNQFKYNYLYSGVISSNKLSLNCAQMIDNFAKLLSAYVSHFKLDLINAQTCIVLTSGFIQFIKYHIQNAGFKSVLIKSEAWSKHLDSTVYNLYMFIFKTYFHLYVIFKEENRAPWDECKKITLELIAQMMLLLTDEGNGYQIVRYGQQYIQIFVQNMIQQLRSSLNQSLQDIKGQKESNHQFLTIVSPMFILQIIQEVQLSEDEIAALLRLRIVEPINLQDFLAYFTQIQFSYPKDTQNSQSLLHKLQYGVASNNKLFDGNHYCILPRIVVRVLQHHRCHSQHLGVSDDCYSQNVILPPVQQLSIVKELIMMLDHLYQNEPSRKKTQLHQLYCLTAKFLLKLSDQVAILDEAGYHLIKLSVRRTGTKSVQRLAHSYELVQQLHKANINDLGHLKPGDVLALFIIKIASRYQNYQSIYQIAKFQPIQWQQTQKQNYEYTQKEYSVIQDDIQLFKNENHFINLKDQYLLMQLLFLQNPMQFIEYFNVNVFENALIAVQQLLSMSILEDETGFPIFYELLINKQLNSIALPQNYGQSQRSGDISPQSEQNIFEDKTLQCLIQMQSSFLVFGFQLVLLEEITISGRYMTEILSNEASQLSEGDSIFQIQQPMDVTIAVLKGLRAVQNYFGVPGAPKNWKNEKSRKINIAETLEVLYAAFKTRGPFQCPNPATFRPKVLIPTAIQPPPGCGLEWTDDLPIPSVQQKKQELKELLDVSDELQKKIQEYVYQKQNSERLRKYELQLLRFAKEWLSGSGARPVQPKQSIPNQLELICEEIGVVNVLSGHYLTNNYFNPICRREVARTFQLAYRQDILGIADQQKIAWKQQLNKVVVSLLIKSDGRIGDPFETRKVFRQQISAILTVLSVHFTHISSNDTFHTQTCQQKYQQLPCFIREAVSDLVQAASTQYVAGEIDSQVLILLIDAIGKHFSKVTPNDDSISITISALIEICQACPDIKVVQQCCKPLRELQANGAQMITQAQLLVVGHLIYEGKINEALGLWFKYPAAFVVAPDHQSQGDAQKICGITDGCDIDTIAVKTYQIFMLLEASRAYQLYDAIKSLVGPYLAQNVVPRQPKRDIPEDVSKLMQILDEEVVGQFGF